MTSDKEKIAAIMKETSSYAYLATSDGDQPRVRPVSPIVEDDLSIWITTFNSSRKVSQIQKNPRISLAFVEYPRGEKAATVIGKAEIIEDLEKKKRVWKLATFDLLEFFPDGPESEEFCLLKIAISKIEWRDSWTGGTKIFEPSP
jgi:general stress protein 26